MFESHKLYSTITSAEYTRMLSKHVLFDHNDRNFLETISDNMGCKLHIAQVGSEHRMLSRFLLKDKDDNNHVLLVITKLDDDYYLVRIPMDDIDTSLNETYKCDQLEGLDEFIKDHMDRFMDIKNQVIK
jgi:hypothetical protein